MPKMYDELASWWPLLSPPGEYEEEAGFYARMLETASDRPLRTVLELGSGGGSNAHFLKKRFAMTLVDPAAGMRAVSLALNPDCEHLDGDMRSVRLGRQFDAVFIHDAVCYMTTEPDLRLAIDTAFLHCRPGGVALFAPDAVRETFTPSTEHGGSDDDTRGLRFLEWTWDPDPSDTTYVADYIYALRTGEEVRVEHDRHIEGIFARGAWLRLLSDAGFIAQSVPFEHSDVERTLEVFVARKP